LDHANIITLAFLLVESNASWFLKFICKLNKIINLLLKSIAKQNIKIKIRFEDANKHQKFVKLLINLIRDISAII